MPNRSALCFAAVVSVSVACAAAAAADVDAVALEAHADFAGAAAALEAKGDATSVDRAVDLRLGLGDDAAFEADLARLHRLDGDRWVQAVVRVAKNEAGRRRCPAAIARLGAASPALSRAHVDVGVVIDATLALARCHEGADFAAARVARRRALALAAGGANASTRKDVVAAVADAEVAAAAESIRAQAKPFPPWSGAEKHLRHHLADRVSPWLRQRVADVDQRCERLRARLDELGPSVPVGARVDADRVCAAALAQIVGDARLSPIPASLQVNVGSDRTVDELRSLWRAELDGATEPTWKTARDGFVACLDHARAAVVVAPNGCRWWLVHNAGFDEAEFAPVVEVAAVDVAGVAHGLVALALERGSDAAVFALARRTVDVAIAAAPDDAGLHVSAAVVEAARGDVAAALVELAAAERGDAKNLLAFLLEAQLRLDVDDAAGAAAAARAAIALANDDVPARLLLSASLRRGDRSSVADVVAAADAAVARAGNGVWSVAALVERARVAFSVERNADAALAVYRRVVDAGAGTGAAAGARAALVARAQAEIARLEQVIAFNRQAAAERAAAAAAAAAAEAGDAGDTERGPECPAAGEVPGAKSRRGGLSPHARASTASRIPCRSPFARTRTSPTPSASSGSSPRCSRAARTSRRPSTASRRRIRRWPRPSKTSSSTA